MKKIVTQDINMYEESKEEIWYFEIEILELQIENGINMKKKEKKKRLTKTKRSKTFQI